MSLRRFKVKRVAVGVTVPIWGPLLLLACMTQVVFLPGEWRLRRDMRRSNRWMSVRAFRRAGLTGGTIIIEGFTFDYGLRRVWWTPDDVVATAPVPAPADGWDWFDEQEVYHWHPFDRWVAESYLRAETGGATLLSCWDWRSVETLRRAFAGHPSVYCFSGGEQQEAFTRGPMACGRVAVKRRARERRRSAIAAGHRIASDGNRQR